MRKTILAKIKAWADRYSQWYADTQEEWTEITGGTSHNPTCYMWCYRGRKTKTLMWSQCMD